MDYKQAKTYLESFVNYEALSFYLYKKAFKLKRVVSFLKLLGNPQKSFKIIHIAGTKGKGSTAAFIAHILKEASFKVGLYTSPHLSDFRERIRILDEEFSCFEEFEGMIKKEEVIKLIEELKPKIEQFNKNQEDTPLTFFEIFTALALMYFKREKIDLAVLETGLGGRLDATNVVKPLISVITPISIEHTQYLGSSLTEIAKEKAGIIKNKTFVISAVQKKPVEEVLKEKSKSSNAKILFVGKDIKIEKRISDLSLQFFSLKIGRKNYEDLEIALKGEFQIDNASLAVAAVVALKFYKIEIAEDAIRKGLISTQWPARFEIMSDAPATIIDGAQNTHSVGVLMDAVKKSFANKKIILVLGISGDKDIKGMCEIFKHSVDEIIITKANNPRAASPARIKQEGDFKNAIITKSVVEAVKLAQASANKDDLILVAGSLFVAGEARQLFAPKFGLKGQKQYAKIKQP